MRRFKALPAALLLLLCVPLASTEEVDPCKRQPFRGRCPSINGAPPTRSQFVLRYYLRNGECVSYPYGHCANDDNEPKLFRYKEECEDACITTAAATEDGTEPPHVDGELTYATVGSSVAEGNDGSTTAYEVPKTECQRQRELKGEGFVKGGFVPECAEGGEFKPLQCEQDGQTCFCVNKDGIEIENSRCRPGQPKPDCEKIGNAAPMRTNECTGAAESGPCSADISRWFYDELDQQCKSFKYSGCGGNGNNYPSEASCQRRCVPPSDGAKCHRGTEPLRTSQGQVVNCAKTDCPVGYKCSVVQQNSVCCPDVEKSPVAGVLHSGVDPQVCGLPKERGPCDHYELRFYYNKEIGECKYFFYGGCEGNANNFAKVEDCEKACGAATTTTTTTLGSTEAASDNTDAQTESSQVTQEPTTEATKSESTTAEEVPEAETESTASEQTTEAAASSTAATEEQTTAATQPEATEAETTESTTAATTTVVRGESEASRPLPREQFRPRPTAAPRTTPPTTTPTTTTPLPPVNRCQHPRDSGSCGGQFVRWYWNHDARTCETFTYTGCFGNGNNFGSREECLSVCHMEVSKSSSVEQVDLDKVCETDIDAGDCSGSFMRYGFDRTTGECRQFQYGGCGGNGNNFPTMSDCRKKCLKEGLSEDAANMTADILTALSTNICDHAIEAGECSGVFNRFAYDKESNECRQFTYGGCGGNGNNFATLVECRTACLKPQCPPEPECDLSRCQLVSDAHGCPFCSCPPPPRPPIVGPRPPVESQPHCPPLDVNLCMEPCIIFSNRRGCKECVCPVMPNHLAPASETPPESAISMPHQPLPPASAEKERLVPPSTQPQPPAAHRPLAVPRPPAPQAPLPVSQPRAPVDTIPRHEIPRGEPPAAPSPPSSAAAPAPQEPPPLSARGVATNTIDENPPLPPQPVQNKIISSLGEKCTQPLDPGPCRNFVQRWHFNPVRGECEPFNYGGCAGNRNHFFTERECEIHCARFLQEAKTQGSSAPASSTTSSPTTSQSTTTTGREVEKPLPPRVEPPTRPRPQTVAKRPEKVDQDAALICVQPPDAGPCLDYVPRWFFNSQSGRCEQFSFGSCGGNANNFMDQTQCELKCQGYRAATPQVPERCAREKDEGFGGGYFPKWYYNVRNLRCEQMVYQGQGGNDNQFSTFVDCDRSCKPVHGLGFERPRGVVPPVKTEAKIPKKSPSEHNVQGAAIAQTQNEQGVVGAPAPAKPIAEVTTTQRYPEETLPAETPAAPVQPEPTPPASPVVQSPVAQKPSYSAEPLPEKQPNMPQLPMLGKSPPAVIDYQTGTRLPGAAAEGIALHVPDKNIGIDTGSSLDFDGKGAGPDFIPDGNETGKEQVEPSLLDNENPQRIPSCPNGLSAMQYSDGRPVMCLPGKNQCPEKSVCYYNGLDFFCCPNEDDPYDQHPFRSNDDEEIKHGYKHNPSSLNIRSIRRLKRSAQRTLPATSFSIDSVSSPLRFDGKPPQKISRAGVANPRVNPCILDVEPGTCNEAQLRYFYDINIDQCRLFYYSGCNGNTNNFVTEADCEKRCKIGLIITTTHAPVPPGRCPNGQMPLGDNAPVLCGNETDSIGCPVGYYCRSGPPDVCCPDDGTIDLERALAAQKNRGDIRRKPFISAAGKFLGGEGHHHHVHEETHSAAYGVQNEALDEKTRPLEVHAAAFGANTEESGPYDVTGAAKDGQSAGSAAVSSSSGSQAGASSSGGASSSASDASSGAQQKAMCPDASDPLTDAAGKPTVCGTGFDGFQMCPKGYYCSIDPERHGRLCCPMIPEGVNIPPPPVNPPFFGVRKPNPGEVIDRGSLPSDPKPPALSTPKPKARQGYPEDESKSAAAGPDHEEQIDAAATTVEAPASELPPTEVPPASDGGSSDDASAPQAAESAQPSNAAPADAGNTNIVVEKEEKPTPLNRAEPAGSAKQAHEPYARMIMKPPSRGYHLEDDGKSRQTEERFFTERSRFDMGPSEDPFEMSDGERRLKGMQDKSVCLLKPTEGRRCTENEPPPRTHLQYYYNAADKKCKLFFYSGCGGNGNRFQSKVECERYCKYRL